MGLIHQAELRNKAAKIIAQALEECSHPTLTQKEHEGNATAIIVRLFEAGIDLAAVDATSQTPQWCNAFSDWLAKKYVGAVFTYNGSGLGIHKRIADEQKEILEKFTEYKSRG